MRRINRILSTAACIVVMSVMFGLGVMADENKFNLIEYCETHQITSQAEFNNVLTNYCFVDETELFVPNSEEYFCLEIDYVANTIITIVREQQSTRESDTNSCSKNFYDNYGNRIFTITVEGTFQFGLFVCFCTSASGSFTKPSSSQWTSTPTISSGNQSPSVAYARISGTATYSNQTRNYSLTLTCDNTGTFGAY